MRSIWASAARSPFTGSVRALLRSLARIYFMMKAYELHPVREAARMSFTPPPGIEIVTIDADTLMLATPLCQNTFEEAFIVGTAPTAYCPLHSLKIAQRF